MDLLRQQRRSQHPDQEYGLGPRQAQDQGQFCVPCLDLVSGGVQGEWGMDGTVQWSMRGTYDTLKGG